ncbi:hypothetical protein NB714_004708 [Pantoea dispersa]|nr:hypothetical protein [Pantoea dispersa]MCW0328583.1 hypothetical protein [Pantoea dispersa]MCW0435008.1 hypothetical protein [Pantoea dispersa]
MSHNLAVWPREERDRVSVDLAVSGDAPAWRQSYSRLCGVPPS